MRTDFNCRQPLRVEVGTGRSGGCLWSFRLCTVSKSQHLSRQGLAGSAPRRKRTCPAEARDAATRGLRGFPGCLRRMRSASEDQLQRRRQLLLCCRLAGDRPPRYCDRNRSNLNACGDGLRLSSSCQVGRRESDLSLTPASFSSYPSACSRATRTSYEHVDYR